MRDDERKFSRAQQAAIRAFGSDVCVSAAAGSGKTRVLVERFLHAVIEKKCDPGRILAITFTEKAANEMKSRLVAACRRRETAWVRRRLENAAIGTIHGFCARILRENPIEGGVDPYFQILGEGEAEILANQVMDRLFEAQIQEGAWIQLLSEYGEETIRKALRNFYELSRATAEGIRIFATPAVGALERKVRRQIMQRLGALVTDLDKPGNTESELLLKSTAQEILSEASAMGKPDGLKILSLEQAMKGRLHRKSPAFSAAVEEIRQLGKIWGSLAIQEMGAPVRKTFEELFDAFRANYDAEKKSRGVYDFEDLLFRAYRLLSGSTKAQRAVRARYRKLFQHLLVDEYQDTSALQDRIVELLRSGRNLFVVGDSQQSIYGFRHADPGIFAERIRKTAKSGRHIRLLDNYRSRHEILGFVNGLLERLTGPSAFFPMRPRRAFHVPSDCPVEVLFVGRRKAEDEDLDGARVMEARTLAWHIRAWAEGGLVIEGPDGRKRAVAYRDIAILFRGMARSYLYEKELADLSIPYFVTKGAGFYEKTEVMDLINLLKVIENPHEDIALAGVLRSPLFQLSDDALFWLARRAKQKNPEVPLADALENKKSLSELSKLDKERLARFKDVFGDLRRNKEAFRISDLLLRALRRTDYEAKTLTRPGGRQRIANLWKLVEITRNFESKNIFGIEDFVRFLQALSEREVPEPESALESPDGNAVRLTTIHAAKGLEFPCVILADMGREAPRGKKDAFLSLPGFGMGLKLKNPLTQERVPDHAFSHIGNLLKAKETEEEQRLFYVAMTRAEQHLVLSGVVALDAKSSVVKPSTSWMSQLASAMEWDEKKEEQGKITFDGLPVKLLKPRTNKETPTRIPSRPLAESALLKRVLCEFRPLEVREIEAAGLPVSREALSAFDERLTRREKDYEETEDQTVTDLLMASWAEERSDSAEMKTGLERGEPDEEEAATPRDEYGTLFHRLMEHLIAKRKKTIKASDIPPRMICALSGAEQKEMVQSVLRFWHGRVGAQVRDARCCYPELPFIYKTGHGLLKGQIDLVLQDKQGGWVILDYKTHPISASQKDELAQAYERQLWIYAAVFAKLYQEAPRQSVIYFAAYGGIHEFNYPESEFKDAPERLERYFVEAAAAAEEGVLSNT